MTKLDAPTRLAMVGSQSEYRKALEDMAWASKRRSHGRPTELKTYIIETEETLQKHFKLGNTKYESIDTGLDKIKILRVSDSKPVEFYLDVNDGRFLFLHTNFNTKDTNRVVKQLVSAFDHAFDHAWFYSDMLKKIPDVCNCKSRGFGIKYSNYLSQSRDLDLDDMSLDVKGALAERIKKLIGTEEGVKNAFAYDAVKISRGTRTEPSRYIRMNVHNTGHLAVKRGRSVTDHLDIVESIAKMYSNTIKKIEKCRIGTNNDRSEFVGHAINFEFPNGIKDLDLFVHRMFSGAEPFKLWGIKEKIEAGYFSVKGVDLHTGARINFEISARTMRVYLYTNNCGNTILRLLTNLQMKYDSDTRCLELADAVAI